MPVVSGGKAAAVIVTADRPTAVADYAARELAEHVEKATGVRLTILTEGNQKPGPEGRIFVGSSRAVEAAGVDVRKLEPEASVLRTGRDFLIIAGDDGRGDALDPDTRGGTLWGVYEWLDRSIGVRWLWPGELGTFVPRTQSVTAAEVDETISPRFFQRKLRPGLGTAPEHEALGFSPEAFKKFSDEEIVFLRRHRMGRSLHAGYGHAFTDWWKKYGKEHPDWFQMREDGKRGPSKPTARFSMCVSNPDLQRQIVSNWEAKHRGATGVPSFINACENDIPGQCSCPACRALDGQPPADYLKFYSPDSKMARTRFVSDRYAHFWLGVQQLAAKTDPEATVIGYVYFNYFQAPVTGVRLNPHVLLGFCPSGGWFPRSEEEHEWMKQQWTGWRNTGARLFMRSNHLLDGYCMPYIFVHQFADEFQHSVREGMVATDFDSLTGQWATQGPNLYVAARLHARPETPVDTLLMEYYSGFGPAAAQAKSYFDYWEKYTTVHRESLNKALETTQTSRWRNFAKAAHLAYPADCFSPAEAILREATTAAAGDTQAAARVEFLKKGLAHSRLAARAAEQASLASSQVSAAGAKSALDELIAFRRVNERSGISNFNHLGWVEDLSWKLPEDLKKAAK